MRRNILALAPLVVACAASTPAVAQIAAVFQQDVNGYTGTIDNEFRAANPVETQGAKDFVSVDEFDGGFQTQGALRFENLFGAQPGQVPLGKTIAFATLTLRIDSSSDADAIISFNRVLAPSPWDEESTWFSLGGDLIPDENGLLDGDPILQDNVESLATPESVVPTPNVSGTFVDIDVTASVNAWYNGAVNLGWGVNNNTGNGWDFRSSEFATITDHPKLTIGYLLKKGDLDFDNDVDLFDYQLLLDNLGVHLDHAIEQGATGDFDFDRDVDLDDFAVFKGEYPGGVPALEAALRGVPEPATGLLALISMVAAGRLRRRKAVHLSTR